MVGRAVNRLTARGVQAFKDPGRHADGGGLYLVVDGSGKRWVMLYRHAGRRREMGLGPLLGVSLARARELAGEARAQLAAGVDPIAARVPTPPAEPVPAPPALTFAEVAKGYMADRERTWRNAAHRRQWRTTLEEHAASVWAMSVAEVDTDAVLAVLRPLWDTVPETARRLRGRMERVLDAARVAGHRAGENPARWRGHLELVLPRARKLTRGHHAALPYAEVPAFMAALRLRSAPAARALELLVLTAARSGEVRGMTWGEVNVDAALWTVPAARMKAKRPHRVPLSPEAVAVLRAVRAGDGDGAGKGASEGATEGQGVRPADAAAPAPPDPGTLVFPGLQAGKLMSDMVFAALLKRMGQGAVTAHGFRSSFRDWAADETDHPREVIEAALAHLVGDETERAYRRGDALAKRALFMADWGKFCKAQCATNGSARE